MAWSTPGHIEADDPGERVDGAEVRGRFTCSCDEIGFSSVFFRRRGVQVDDDISAVPR